MNAGHRLLHLDHPSPFRGAERRPVQGHDGAGGAGLEGRQVRQVRDPRDRSGRRLNQDPENPEASAGYNFFVFLSRIKTGHNTIKNFRVEFDSTLELTNQRR